MRITFLLISSRSDWPIAGSATTRCRSEHAFRRVVISFGNLSFNMKLLILFSSSSFWIKPVVHIMMLVYESHNNTPQIYDHYLQMNRTHAAIADSFRVRHSH